MTPAIIWLREHGMEPVFGKHLYDESNQYAGNDEDRAADLQEMLDDPSIRAIWVARGGYGTVRLLDYLNLETLKINPKWIVGYSDITALHGYIQNHASIATIHGTMPINIHSEPDANEIVANERLLDALLGRPISYKVAPHPLDRGGRMEGRIVGGNLSVLYSMTGTDAFPDVRNTILFLEDLDEYLYHIDRMMMNFKRAGILENLNGVIVGGMTDMNDNTIPYGKTAEDIIYEHLKDFDYPVKFGFPAGHIPGNSAIRLGATCVMENGVFQQSVDELL